LGTRIDTTALMHTVGAFAFLAFFIIHVYLTTTGHTVFSNIKAMITGSERLEAVDLQRDGSIE